MANILDQFIDFCLTVAVKVKDTTLTSFVKKEFGKVQSINTLAKKSIFHFPVIASDSCVIETLKNIVNFVERKNALLIKLVIERIGVIDLSADDTKEDIIKRIKGFDGYVSESIEVLDPAIEMIKKERDRPVKKKSFLSSNLLKEHEEIDVLDGLQESILAQVKLNNKAQYTFNTDKRVILNEKKEDYYSNIYSDHGKKEDEINNVERNNFLKDKKLFGNKIFSRGEVVHKSGSTAAYIANEKKINQAEPTMIEVSFSYYVKGVQSMSNQKVTLGVKSMLHMVPSDELHELLPKSRVDDTKFLIKLGKLTSGEIKFFKDFVANASSARRFFTGEGGGKNNWINKLKHLTEINRMRKHLGNQILPTYSLVLSTEDVETMRVNTNGKFDLFQKRQAALFSQGLSLLNFVIVDEANEKLFWLEDAESDFDIISFESIKNENKSMSQKDLFKIMLKLNN